jgi:hypothetical protein
MFKLLSGCIASTDNLLTINVEQYQDSTIFGRVTLLPSKIEIVTQFTKRSSSIYATRLRIDAEILQEVKAASLTIEVVSSKFSQTYAQQNLPVDIDKIKSCIISAKHKEVQELKLQIRGLEETLKALTEGRALTKLNLKNTDSIAPGMVPVAIDSKGTFIGAYPFNDMIKDINGVTPISGSLRLLASNIPLSSELSIQEGWDSYIETTAKILDFIRAIESQLSKINIRIQELETKLATHLNTGVI